MTCNNCHGADWCRQSDSPCDRYDGTSRPAELDEALPNPPDPAVGVSDGKAVCIAGALFTLAILGYIGAIMAGLL